MAYQSLVAKEHSVTFTFAFSSGVSDDLETIPVLEMWESTASFSIKI